MSDDSTATLDGRRTVTDGPCARKTASAPAGCSPSSGRSRILEVLAGNGGVMGLSALAAESGLPLPTIHRLARTLVDLGYLRQEPSRQYALGPAHPAAGRELVDDAERRRPPASGPAGRRARRDGQPGVAGRRSDRLHLAGAVPAFDADVHRGRPPGTAALHGRRQGDHGRHAAGRGARTVAAHRHAAAHRAHHHRPGGLRRAAGVVRRARLRHRRRRAGTRRAVRCRRGSRRPGAAGAVGVRAGRPDDPGDRRPRGAAAHRRRGRTGRRTELTAWRGNLPSRRRAAAS